MSNSRSPAERSPAARSPAASNLAASNEAAIDSLLKQPDFSLGGSVLTMNPAMESISMMGHAYHAPGEDEEDEDWTRRAWELFSRTAKRGVLDIEQFVAWAAELNVECDPALVQRILPEDQHRSITFDNAIKTLEIVPTFGQTDEVADDGNESSEGTTKLGFFEYVWRVWLCGEKEEGQNYSLAVQCHLSPRFWLLFNAALVFILISAAIITLISFLWLDNARSRDRTTLKQFQETLAFIMRTVAATSLDISGRDLQDQVVTLSRWMERLWVLQLEESRGKLLAEMSQNIVFLNNEVTTFIDLDVSEMSERMLRYANVIDGQALGIPLIVAMVKKWIARSPHWDVVVYNNGLNFTQWSSINSTVAASNFFHTRCYRELQSQRSGMDRRAIGLDGRNESVLLWRSFFSEGAGVCMSLSRNAQRLFGRHKVIDTINDINRQTFERPAIEFSSVRPELMVAANTMVNVNGLDVRQFSILTRKKFYVPICSNPGDVANCMAFEDVLFDCYNSSNIGGGCSTPRVEHRVYYTTDPVQTVLVYLPSIDAVVAQSVLVSSIRQDFKDRMIRIVEDINANLDSTIEIVWAARNQVGKIIPQVTSFRFAQDCYVECKRIPESVNGIVNTFLTQDRGFALYPDYRPAPIMGAFSYLQQDLDMVLAVERDVTELRQLKLQEIAASVDAMNRNFEDNTEVTLFRQQGMPVSATFDPFEPCADNAICTYGGELGILARTDCPDCLRQPTNLPLTVEYVNALRFPQRCPTCNMSNSVQPTANNEIAITAFQNPTTQSAQYSTDHTDYGETQVTYFVTFLSRFSTFLQVKRDIQETEQPVVQSISILVVIACCLVFAGVIGLVILSRRTLNRIEEEWRTYKDSIEAEKQKFDEMIREIVPASVLSRFRRGQRAVAEAHTSVSYAYIDICGFSERMKGRGAREVVRTSAYYFILYDAVATKYALFRLKTFGDVAVYAAGLESKKSDPAGAQGAFAVASFAGYLIQLLSSVFAHFPQRLPQLSETFKNEPDVPMTIIPLRIGLHTGPVTSGLVDTGGTPFYEHYGTTLALSHRLQATCQPSKAHASSTFKELVESVDARNTFEFDSLRKTMVKGRGTITSYPIRSVQLVIDDFLLYKMRIEYAQRMFMFSHKTGMRERGTEGEGTVSDSTSVSQSTYKSARSSKYGSHKSSSDNSEVEASGYSSSDSSTNHTTSTKGPSRNRPPALIDVL